MTYRYVPKRWLQVTQLFTLLVTAIVGLGIRFTPQPNVSHVTAFEHTMMNPIWAYLMTASSMIGFIFELWMWVDHRHPDNHRYVNLVSSCHIACVGILVGYSAGAVVTMIERQPWTFSTPSIGFLLAWWHLVFVKRRPHVI